MADFGNVAEQAKQFWSTRSGRQKALLLAGAGITVVLLTIFARLMGTPTTSRSIRIWTRRTRNRLLRSLTRRTFRIRSVLTEKP